MFRFWKLKLDQFPSTFPIELEIELEIDPLGKVNFQFDLA
jgi:hypothetical protein